MPYDLKLMIDGLTSPESGGLDVLTFDWGTAVETAAGSGTTTGKVKFNPFTITRKIDKTSPALFRMATTGSRLPNIVLWGVAADVVGVAASRAQPFLKLTLKDAFITSVEVTGAVGGDERPIETISLIYREFEISVT